MFRPVFLFLFSGSYMASLSVNFKQFKLTAMGLFAVGKSRNRGERGVEEEESTEPLFECHSLKVMASICFPFLFFFSPSIPQAACKNHHPHSSYHMAGELFSRLL